MSRIERSQFIAMSTKCNFAFFNMAQLPLHAAKTRHRTRQVMHEMPRRYRFDHRNIIVDRFHTAYLCKRRCIDKRHLRCHAQYLRNIEINMPIERRNIRIPLGCRQSKRRKYRIESAFCKHHPDAPRHRRTHARKRLANIDIGVNRILFALPFDDIARLQDEKLTLCKRKFDILCTPKRRFNIGGNAHEFADLFGC